MSSYIVITIILKNGKKKSHKAYPKNVLEIVRKLEQKYKKDIVDFNIDIKIK